MKLIFTSLTATVVNTHTHTLTTLPALKLSYDWGPPTWELLGNQNQLLVLSPLSWFWLFVSCRVVFSGSSKWTPPLWPWHHCTMENLPHFLLFFAFIVPPMLWLVWGPWFISEHFITLLLGREGGGKLSDTQSCCVADFAGRNHL